jgi:hypothetical protein
MTYARYGGVVLAADDTDGGRRKATQSWCAGCEALYRTHRRIEAMCSPPRETDLVDIRVENHGSIALLRPLALRTERWLRDVVEPRYIAVIVAGSREGGLEVR